MLHPPFNFNFRFVVVVACICLTFVFSQGAFRRWVREHCDSRVALEPDAASRLYCSQGPIDDMGEGPGAASAGGLESMGPLDMAAPLTRKGSSEPAALSSSQQSLPRGGGSTKPSPHAAPVLTAPPMSIYGHNNPSPYRPAPSIAMQPVSRATMAGGIAARPLVLDDADMSSTASLPLPLLVNDNDEEGAVSCSEDEKGAADALTELPSSATQPSASAINKSLGTVASNARTSLHSQAPPVASHSNSALAASHGGPGGVRPRISDFFGKPISHSQESGSYPASTASAGASAVGTKRVRNS